MSWQKDMMNKLGGMKPSEMMVIKAGRQIGKSVIYEKHWDSIFQQYMSDLKFRIHDKATVDGEQWYTVGCSKEVSSWMRIQPKDLWHEHIDEKWTIHLNRFDIHEKLYTQLALTWS